MKKQMDAIEKCLTPIVQAYYADYNKSLDSLTAICDDFRKNQKEVQELLKRVQDVKARLEVAYRHAESLVREKGERIGISESRKHMAWYVHGMRGAAAVRGKLMQVTSLGDIRKVFGELAEENGRE